MSEAIPDVPKEPPEAAPVPRVSGADLARVALRAAQRAAAERGVDADASPSKPRRKRPAVLDGREPVGLGAALKGLMADRAWDAPVAGGAIQERWTVLAPELCRGVAVVHHDPETGQLDLRPSSPTWATQARITAPALVLRIAQQVGPGVVESIRVLPPGRTDREPEDTQAAAFGRAGEAGSGAPPRGPSAGYLRVREAWAASRPERDLPSGVQAAIDRQNAAMAREPEDHFQDAVAYQEHLAQLQAERAAELDPGRRAVRRARAERSAASRPLSDGA